MDRPFSLFTRGGTAATVMGIVPQQLLYVFLGFHIVAQIALSILIATFVFSKSAKRHPTVVNICLTWIIGGIISTLLLYAGKHIGPEPSKMLCTSQASLLDGTPPMNSVAVLALVYQVHQTIRNPKAKSNKLCTYALLIAPYVAFFCFASSAALLAMRHPETVNRARRFFYCSFPSPITNAFAIFVAVMLILTLGFQISICVFMCKNWGALRHSGYFDLQFLTRVSLFGVYILITLILCLLSVHAPHSPLPDLFAASIGPAIALILGTQPDVYRAWFRRPQPVPPRVIDDWVTVETGDKDRLELGSKALCDEEATEGGKAEAGVIDISAKFKPLEFETRRRSPSFVVACESGAEEMNIMSPRRGYNFEPGVLRVVKEDT